MTSTDTQDQPRDSSEGSRLLGVDLGDVRVGLALSDILGITAQPLPAIKMTGTRILRGQLAELVEAENVGTVVIGLPLLLSGEEGERAVAARDFAERLSRRLNAVHVELWDERLTSRQLERTMIGDGVRRDKRRKVVDSLSAVLILEGYLEAQSFRNAD
jgi:putative Holliday junction resolvase